MRKTWGDSGRPVSVLTRLMLRRAETRPSPQGPDQIADLQAKSVSKDTAASPCLDRFVPQQQLARSALKPTQVTFAPSHA